LKPILQIALDFTDLFEAIALASKIVSEIGCTDVWLEAGTPLIKSWGKLPVKILKDLTKCTVVADAKTMDTGALEAEIFYKAGADVYTVLGLSDDNTIMEALGVSKKYHGLLSVDLINHPKPYERAVELDRLGVDIVLYHVGIDVQRSRGITIRDLLSEIKGLKKTVSTKIAVAGGIKLEDVEMFLEAEVDVLIVGGAITKSRDPVASTKMFLEKIRERAL